MARPAKTSGKRSAGEARKASFAKARTRSKAKRPGRLRSTSFQLKLREAHEQQAATAEILKVIANSPSDAQPVLEAVALQANRLIGGLTTVVWRILDGVAHLAAYTQADPRADAALEAGARRIPLSSWQIGEAIQRGNVFSVVDTERSVRSLRELARVRGFRSVVYVPMLHKCEAIGIVGVTRAKPGKFADHHVKLLQTFADQAVIAIENARLFNEVQSKKREVEEALTYQTASSSILGVIASSPTNVAPALQAIVEGACTLCDAYDANVLLKVGDDLHYSAHHGPIPTGLDKWPINRRWVTGRSVIDRVPLQVSDLLSPEADEFPDGREHSRRMGHRCILSVPLLREDEAIGAIAIRRLEPVAFTDKQIALLQTFADQAVIAIENARLFNEVQAKSRDLEESLRQQTATADVLKVISRSTIDIQPVFDVIAQNSVNLCEAERAFIFRYDGQVLRAVAHCNTGTEVQEFVYRNPIALGRHSISARAAIERRTIHIADVQAEPDYAYALQDVSPIRTLLAVPMLKGEELIGIITSYKLEIKPFSDEQIALMEAFASQAVIAIENTRLFNETKEALERQTATSEVLEIISSSPGELEPVFDKMLESACRVCEANFGFMQLWDGESFRSPASYNVPPALAALRVNVPVRPDPLSGLYAAMQTRRVVHRPDVRETPAYRAGVPHVVEMADVGGARTLVIVPMLKEDEFL